VRVFAAACALLLAVTVPVIAFAAPTPAPATGDPNALVREALDSPRHVSYVGQLQTIRWGNRVANATIQRIEHLAPSSTRRTFLAPEALYGEYDITLGTTTTKIDPKQKRAMVSENPSSENAIAMNNNIMLLAKNYRAVVGPVEIVAARPATTISLVNKFSGERMMRLWIDNETKVVLAKEAYHQDGSLAWRSRFDEIRFTKQIPNGIFSTTIPQGFKEVEGRRFAEITDDLQRTVDDAGFKPINPKYLPDGFSVIGAENSIVGGKRNLHLLYSDGIRSLSLFENNAAAEPDFRGVKPSVTRFEGHDARYVKDGPTTLLAWREHGLAFTLVGDLDLKNLTAIAISIVP
jgi:negative regulator of sigma E activity